MPRLDQKGVIAQVLVLLILLIGLVAGYYLIKNPQIFKPKASDEKVTWITPVGEDSENCITVKDGKKIATCPNVKFRVDVPVQVK